MGVTRHKIISALYEPLESNPKVLALWLEGADTTGTVDEYSDLDICCSVKPGMIPGVRNHVQEILESIGPVDFVENLVMEENSQHTVFHLAGTSEYLLIDFVLFVGRGSTFVEADEIEKPLVLFDKSSVIKYLDQEEHLKTNRNSERIQKLRNTVAQRSRINKYVKRGQFLEAYGYYHRWLLEPLIEILRMRYTPLHPDYYIVHISRHLPPGVLTRLEELFKTNSLIEIEAKSKDAQAFFTEVAEEIDTNTIL